MFELMPCLLAGSPFTDPTGPLPASGAHNLKVRDHAGNDLFATPLTPFTWHNFAVQIDWDNLTLGVFYSSNNAKLTATINVPQNTTASLGATGQGDFLRIQYEKMHFIYLNDARRVERRSAL